MLGRFITKKIAVRESDFGCGLRRQIPVRLDFDTLAHPRITLIPQRRPACRGYAWRLMRRWALWRHGLGLGLASIAHWHHPWRALARVGLPGLHRGRLGRCGKSRYLRNA